MSSEQSKEGTVAMWSVSLDCECPHCGKDVNLLDDGDFWDSRDFEVAEHATERTQNVDVWCPECGEQFQADFHY